MSPNYNLMINTLAGTLLSIFYIEAGEIVKAIFLASIGATVSFFVSLSLRYLLRKIKKLIGR